MKIILKTLFLLFAVCVVLAFWSCLTGCAELMFPPETLPHETTMEEFMQRENVWPQGCFKRESEIPKLTCP